MGPPRDASALTIGMWPMATLQQADKPGKRAGHLSTGTVCPARDHQNSRLLMAALE